MSIFVQHALSDKEKYEKLEVSKSVIDWVMAKSHGGIHESRMEIKAGPLEEVQTGMQRTPNIAETEICGRCLC